MFSGHRCSRWTFVALTVLTLVACGGGGGGNGSSPPTVPSGGMAWATATSISNGSGAYEPQIDIDAAGNAVAVWVQNDGTRDNIWAARYEAATGAWGVPELIEADDAGDANGVQVAVDAAGNAIAIWHNYDGTRYNIKANRYVAGTGWESPLLIEHHSAGNAYAPQIDIDAYGNAMAVWRQFDGTRESILSNRYVVGTGWGTPEKIETSDLYDADTPQIAVDVAGNAIAVWVQYTTGQESIWTNYYTLGSGWGAEEPVETWNGGPAMDPQVAFNATGDAVAVWAIFDGTYYSIWSRRYTAGSGWGPSIEFVETNSGNASAPRVAVDPAGNAVAVWMQYDAGRHDIWSNRHIPGTSWATPEKIETDDSGTAAAPRVVVDTAGNAFAVWSQFDATGRLNIWSGRFDVGTGTWGAAGLIEMDDLGNAYTPKIGIDANGRAIAIWHQFDAANVSAIRVNHHE